MLLENRNEEWGWGERTEAEAILGLHLADDVWLQKTTQAHISVLSK
jgi:hypothetical protein